MLNSTPKHNHFTNYSPGDSIPFTFMQGALRPATFLGKSLTHCLIEYEVRGNYFVMKCVVSGDIVYPMGAEKQRKHVKYDLEYWCLEPHFALLENAALNGATWHQPRTLMGMYLEAREKMHEGLIQKIAKGKVLHGHERATIKQPCLPMFEEVKGVGARKE